MSIGDREGLKQISSSPIGASIGNLYGAVTVAFGFEYASGEGKIETLATFGVESDLLEKFRNYIQVDGLRINGYINPHHRRISVPISRIIEGYSKKKSLMRNSTFA